MSKAITKIILVILILSVSYRMNAQQWLGRTTGNYSGTYGLYNNASSIADSKYKFYLNFWGRGVNFYNNNMLYNAPIKLNQWANGTYDLSYQRPDGKADFQKDWLIETMNGKTKQFSFNQDIWGPAFMFPLSRKVNMSINTRQRNSLQVFGISEPLARMAYNGIDSGSSVYKGNNALGMNSTYSNGKFGINMQSYQELSFSFAGILAKNDHHQLTGGTTVKFIRGLGAAYVKGKGFDMGVTGNNSASLSNADLQYAYTDENSVVTPFNKPYGLFTLQSNGGGAGVDLGLTYTYTAKKGKYATNKYCNDINYKSDYDVKIAAAFNDIGGVRYNQGAYKYSYKDAGSTNLKVSSNVLNGFNKPRENALDSIGQSVFGQLGATKSHGFNTTLPTAFNFQADFRFTKHFFTAVYLNQSLKGINSTGMKSTSMLSIIPRVESRGVEFSMPLTLADNYKSFNMGAYLRVGPVFFGSDNLGGLLNVASKNQFSGADIYGGISFGIGHCRTYWHEDKVEPNRIDTVTQKDTLVKKDTLKIIQHDTIKIIKHDTIIINKKGEQINKIIHDTLYIEKTIKSKADIDKENDLKNRESILIIRQRQLDQREKDLKEKEKGTYNEAEAVKKCKDENTVLITENVTLKNKNTTNEAEIVRLQKQIDDLKKIKTDNDAEIVKTKNDATLAKKKADSLQAKLTSVNVDLTNCKKNNGTTNDAEIVKAKNDATLAKKKSDSLQAKLDAIVIDLTNCKKSNGTTNDAEIVKAKNDATLAKKKSDSLQAKLDAIVIDLTNCKKNNGTTNEAEIVKAKNDATLAKKKSDSLQAKLDAIVIDLTNCKKSNGTTNEAEIVKAKNDAMLAKKKSDSLQAKLDAIVIDLSDCKKSNTQNEANIIKLKKAEDDKALYKSELDGMIKTNQTLNAKIYKKDATIDSLITELSKCGNSNNTDNNAELLKKCNDVKLQLNAEIIGLKNKVSATQKSLDSMTEVTTNLKKDKALLDAQIVDLNARIKSNNCDELTKQIEEKNKTISDLNTQNTTLQAKVTSLTNELNGLKTEYNFVNTQNQKCSKKLDSCMRGLLNKDIKTPPADDKGLDNGKGGGGPFEGNTDSRTEATFNTTSYNFGSVEEGEKVEATFTLSNTGTEPVKILGYEAFCGCLTANFSTDPILPGQSKNVTVEFNSDGKSGLQSKRIAFSTTAGKEELSVIGVVKEKNRGYTSSENKRNDSNGGDNKSTSGENRVSRPGIGLMILKAIIEGATSSSSGNSGTTTGSGRTSTDNGSGTTRTNNETTTSTTTKTNTESTTRSTRTTTETNTGRNTAPANTNTSTRRR